MKNQFAYYGIKAGPRRELTAEIVKQSSLKASSELITWCRELWGLPQREYQMTALDLLIKNRKKLSGKNIGYLKELITVKSWWDTVDALATNVVGYLVKNDRALNSIMEGWINHKNMWLNRTAILYQLKYKGHTDWNKLQEYIHRHSDSREFFLQKAIGWVLREYSKTEPDRVKNFIGANKKSLAPLSQREGLKWLLNH